MTDVAHGLAAESVLRVEITLTGSGTGSVQRRILQAPRSAVDPTDLLARLGSALPEFETVDWYMDYLPVGDAATTEDDSGPGKTGE